MRPEYYADLYRLPNIRKKLWRNQVYKIACGASVDDYNWTEVLMGNVGKVMDGLSLRYYTIQGIWDRKGSAVDFRRKSGLLP